MTATIFLQSRISQITSGITHPMVWLGICLGVTGYQFQDTIRLLVEKWSSSGTYAHGFMILPIALYLIWEKRQALKTMALEPAAIALIPIIICVNFWYIGQQNQILILQQFSLITLSISLVLGFCGFTIFKFLLFPLMYLYFAIPFGHFLVAELQDITAFFAVKGLEWTGITVYAEGWLITTTRGQFEVAAACSGIRYLIASIALGVLYAHFAYSTIWRKCAFLALCIIVPIIANGIRAYGIVLLAHMTHMKLAVGVDHLIYGWIFFGLMILLLFWFGTLMREKSSPPVSMIQPKVTTYQKQSLSQKHGKMILIIFVFGMSFICASYVFQAKEINFERVDVLSNMTFNDWSAEERQQNNWQPNFIGAEQQLIRLRNEKLKKVDFFVAQYQSETQGKELISSSNAVYDTKIWNKASRRKAEVTFLGQVFDCAEYELFNRYGRRLIWAWYRVNGYNTQNIIVAKLLVLYHRLKGDLQAPVFMAVSSEYQYYPENARAHMIDFLDKSEVKAS